MADTLESPPAKDFDFQPEEEYGFLPDESVVKAAVDIPQYFTGKLQKVLPVIGPSIESTREYLAPQRGALEAMRIAALPPGGAEGEIASEAGTPFTQPFTEGPAEIGRLTAPVVSKALQEGYQALHFARGTPETFVLGKEGTRVMTPREMAERAFPTEGPTIQFPRSQLQAEGTDIGRLVENLSTPANMALIAAGQGGEVAGYLLLGTMLPGIAQDVTKIAQGEGTPEEKRDRVNNLFAALGFIFHGGARVEGELPEPIRRIRGLQPGETPGEELAQTAETLKPLTLTGAAIPGLPQGATPIRVTSGPEVLGPRAPRWAQAQVQMPEISDAPIIQAIRDRNLRTRAQVQYNFPHLSNERAAQVLQDAYPVQGPPLPEPVEPGLPPRVPNEMPRTVDELITLFRLPQGQNVRQKAAQLLQRLQRQQMPPGGVPVQGPPPAGGPVPFPREVQTGLPQVEPQVPAAPVTRAEAEQGQINEVYNRIEQLRATFERELAAARARGDKTAENHFARELQGLVDDMRPFYEQLKRIFPKQPTPRAPASAFPPVQPGTPGEVAPTAKAIILKEGIKTIEGLLDRFPNMKGTGGSRNWARNVLREAWGQWPPPGAEGPGAPPAPKPPEEPPDEGGGGGGGAPTSPPETPPTTGPQPPPPTGGTPVETPPPTTPSAPAPELPAPTPPAPAPPPTQPGGTAPVNPTDYPPMKPTEKLMWMVLPDGSRQIVAFSGKQWIGFPGDPWGIARVVGKNWSHGMSPPGARFEEVSTGETRPPQPPGETPPPEAPAAPAPTEPAPTPPPAPAPVAAEAPTPAPEAPTEPPQPEPRKYHGRTLDEWFAVTDPSQLPKGEARAAFARLLGVENQPSKILRALRTDQARIRKRIAEIEAPSSTEIFPVQESRPPGVKPEATEWITAAAYQPKGGTVESGPNHPDILKRLGIAATFPTAESRNTPEFGFVTNKRPFISREEAGPVSTAAGQNLKDFEPNEPVHSDEVASPTQPDKPLGDVPAPGTSTAISPKSVPRMTEKGLTDLMDSLRAGPRGPDGTVKITNKVIKAQRENLLAQISKAISDAPEKGTDKITISVPGDGDFTVFNNKATLKKFQEIAKKDFPKGTGAAPAAPSKPSVKPSAVPKAVDPETDQDLAKVGASSVSTDPNRLVLNSAYSDGTQIISTDGRTMLRIVTDKAPGSLDSPVRIDSDGKLVDEPEGTQYPNYNQVIPQKADLVRGGVETAPLWTLAKQASAIWKGAEEKEFPKMELLLNPDGTIGGKTDRPGVGNWESNVKPGAKSLGNYNPDYILRGADSARRLGNEKVDLYVDGDTGPLMMNGKNSQFIVMPMRTESQSIGGPVRSNPKAIAANQPVHGSLPLGLGPLKSPESFLMSGEIEKAGGKYRTSLERGIFNFEQFTPKVGIHGSSRWDPMGGLELKDYENLSAANKRKLIAETIKERTGKAVSEAVINGIQKAADDLMSERRALQREAASRKPSMGPGAAAAAEFDGNPPSPAVLGLNTGSPTYNRMARSAQNLYQGMRQLWSRRATKQDFMQWINAATNIPKQAGLEAGNSIRTRANREQQNAMTAQVQAFKMADLPGEFHGNAIGWLRSVVTDMETLAQRRLQQGQKIEAQAALDMRNAARYAADNFNELQPLSRLFKQKTDLQHQRLGQAGIDVEYENWYAPQRHDLDLFSGADRPIVLGSSKGGGGTGQFQKAKVYQNYPEAIENGFVPRSLSAADLLEHYVSTTERRITYKNLFNSLNAVTDTVDGKPLAMPIPQRTITRADGTQITQASVPIGYTALEVMPGVRLAVHDGYTRLIGALTARSQLAESAIVGTLSDVAAFEKHMTLALDSFHASRTLQAELALTGKVSLPGTKRLARGQALAEMSIADLGEAVRRGHITQEIADWIQTPVPTEVNGRTLMLSPKSIFKLGLQSGLNVTRFADRLYRDWLKEVPIMGPVSDFAQRWVFDKMTRSAMSQAYLSEFVRVAKANPELTAKRVGMKVASDLNVMFGNLQAESFFRNPSMRSINNILFLAPQWVEALARREGRTVLQLGGTLVRAARGEGLHVGTVSKGIGTGLMMYFAATQIANLITRGHLTFSNPERGHKLDAWLPIGPRGMFVSPLSVFGEVTHDIIRFAYSKPDWFQVGTQIASNKLGNMGRLIEVILTGRDPLTGDKVVGTARRAIKAATQLVPVPITLSGAVREAGSALGVVPAAPPGSLQRQLASSLGLKTEPAPSANQQVRDLAQRWALRQGGKIQADAERRLQEEFGPSAYRDLRFALDREDYSAAKRAYQALRAEGKTPTVIRQTMEHPRPLAGSLAAETKFRNSLNPEEKKIYRQALDDRNEAARRFHHMLNVQ